MKFIVIIPAYNEEALLPSTMNSIVRQTLPPDQLIVVNDGSTDRTGEIITTFADRYAWIKRVDTQKKPLHSGGAKVVQAFNAGLEQIDPADWSIVYKLDADIELPEHYFEEVMNAYKSDPELGMVSGITTILEDGEWRREKVGDADHTRGPIKSYRRACLEAMNGLRPTIGWDSLDEMLALYHGWEVKVIPSLEVKHHRPTGAETGQLKVMRKVGRGMYRSRYGLWITLISAAKLGLRQSPKVLTGLFCVTGWIQGWIGGEKPVVSKEEGRYIRSYRWKRMRNKLVGRK